MSSSNKRGVRRIRIHDLRHTCASPTARTERPRASGDRDPWALAARDNDGPLLPRRAYCSTASCRRHGSGLHAAKLICVAVSVAKTPCTWPSTRRTAVESVPYRSRSRRAGVDGPKRLRNYDARVRPELAAAHAAVDEAVKILRDGRARPHKRIGKAAKDFLTEVDLASELAMQLSRRLDSEDRLLRRGGWRGAS
jgi:hypothetical protein